MSLIYVLDLCAVSVCAITATLEARRSELDLFGVTVIAVIAGIGGGTVRDLLLGRLPVYWVYDASYVVVGLVAGTLTFFLARRLVLPKNFFLIPDAVGMALFTVIGTSIALGLGTPSLVAALMGVITAVFGGVIRDILCNEVPLIFRTDIYATASLAGAGVLIALDALGIGHNAAVLIAMVGTVAIRLAAMRWHIQLPRLRDEGAA
ncbi:trimeric intracellular cation channel family protein [Parasulfuritortus cantonensis]|uniref:Trimeric intracellular cation channel family protein n=1 Tax=Parasulfuritortus cantonensis TaxID=2528202 RepID=A0A4R1BLD5_9PROT|nr:trimeric intracellular cation channel family protein [Parasulfuritortus cantonensis]TCJ18183.1 trimeric intracellular cation channel family protein [Parasulfuritortus cantonensis]